jgi:glycerophosphoryl diester phosphodiesterase
MIRDLLKRGPLAVAHRGDPMKRPQNTRSSFLSALEYDIDMIETDLNLTRDGRLVVIHDQIVDFTSNGTGEVYSFTLAELQRLDFGSWMGPAFSGETIMTLEELLDLARGHDIALNIEIKNGPRIYEGIAEKVVAVLNDRSAADRVIISSFDHAVIRHVKEIAPDIVCGILFSGGFIDPVTPARLAGADGLHPEYSWVHESLVSAARAAGLFVNVWTVDSQQQIKRMADLGVTGILSNYPERLVVVLKGKTGASGA